MWLAHRHDTPEKKYENPFSQDYGVLVSNKLSFLLSQQIFLFCCCIDMGDLHTHTHRYTRTFIHNPGVQQLGREIFGSESKSKAKNQKVTEEL
jgi:hypothetical protein